MKLINTGILSEMNNVNSFYQKELSELFGANCGYTLVRIFLLGLIALTLWISYKIQRKIPIETVDIVHFL